MGKRSKQTLQERYSDGKQKRKDVQNHVTRNCRSKPLRYPCILIIIAKNPQTDGQILGKT